MRTYIPISYNNLDSLNRDVSPRYHGGFIYREQVRKIKRVLCKYGNVMDEKYTFYISYSKFYVSNISTYKYAEALATNYPLVYFQLMNFDPIFLQNSSSVEEAVIVSIAHAKLLGWNGII
jgi:hypothetical protein